MLTVLVSRAGQPTTQHVSEQVKMNPLDLAQKRLACGEITLREYQKIARALIQTA